MNGGPGARINSKVEPREQSGVWPFVQSLYPGGSFGEVKVARHSRIVSLLLLPILRGVLTLTWPSGLQGSSQGDRGVPRLFLL